MTNIYERIGEAILSNGQYDIIRANDANEEEILLNAGFIKLGSIKEDNKIVALFKIEQKQKELIKIVEVPSIKKDITSPFDKTPFGPPNPGIWYYNEYTGSPYNPLIYSYTSCNDGESNKLDYKKVSDLYSLTIAGMGNNKKTKK